MGGQPLLGSERHALGRDLTWWVVVTRAFRRREASVTLGAVVAPAVQDTLERSILNALSDATVAINKDASVVFMNAAAGQALGAVESIGDVDTLFQRLSGDEATAAALRQGLEAVIRGESRSFGLDCRRPSDGDRSFAITMRAYDTGTHRGVLVCQRDITDRVREEDRYRAMADQVRESEERFRIIAELSSEGLVLTDQGVVIDANTALCDLFGYRHDEIIGRSAIELTAPEDRPQAIEHISSGSDEPYEARGIRKDGSLFPGLIKGRSIPYKGKLVRGTTIIDLSAQREAEVMLRRTVAQEEQIRAQNQRLAELSTPLVPITDEIVALPLIGHLDATRAQLVMDSLLQGIAGTQIHTAIIDLTGVRAIDTNVAGAILRIAKAVRLLGANVVITGLSAEVAQTLVALGIELTSVEVCGTLQNGIVHAMKTSKSRKGARDD